MNNTNNKYNCAMFPIVLIISTIMALTSVVGSDNAVNPNPCDSIDFLNYIEVSDAALGLYVKDNFLYVADRETGLKVYSLADPHKPKLIGSHYESGRSSSRDIDIFRNMAVVTEGAYGYRIFDVSDPTNPNLVYYSGSPGDWSHFTDVYIADHVAYFANDPRGLLIFDLSDPYRPKLTAEVRLKGGVVSDLYVQDHYVYLTTESAIKPEQSRLSIFDVADRTKPVLISSQVTPGRVKSLTVANDYAYIAAVAGGLYIVDISNPRNPRTVGKWEDGSVANVYVYSNIAYAVDAYRNRVYSIDVRNPTSPRLISQCKIYGGASFDGKKSQMVDIVVRDEYIYVANWRKINILKCVAKEEAPPVRPPSPITDLTVVATATNSITLSWTSPKTNDGSSSVAAYETRYSTSLINMDNIIQSKSVNNPNKPNIPGDLETFCIEDLDPNTDYYFVVRSLDNSTNWSKSSNIAKARTQPQLKPVISTPPSSTGFWKSLGSSFDEEINALAVYDGQLIAGGDFTSVDGTIVNHIARWNGRNWTPMGSGVNAEGFNAEVRALAVYNDQLIAGGIFSSAGSSKVDNIVAWDSYTWSQLGHCRNTGISALLVYDQKLIAGGGTMARLDDGSTETYSFVTSWDGSDWKQLGSFSGQKDLRTLSVYNGQLIAGGDVGFSHNSNIFVWNGSSWFQLGEWNMGTGQALAFSVHNGQLIAGGVFRLTDNPYPPGNNQVNNVVLTGRNWSPLGKVVNDREKGAIIQFSLTVYNDQLIAGYALCDDPVGIVDGTPYYTSIAYWSDGSWIPIGWGGAYAFTIYNGQLTAGGNFWIDGTLFRNTVAVWSEQ